MNRSDSFLDERKDVIYTDERSAGRSTWWKQIENFWNYRILWTQDIIIINWYILWKCLPMKGPVMVSLAIKKSFFLHSKLICSNKIRRLLHRYAVSCEHIYIWQCLIYLIARRMTLILIRKYLYTYVCIYFSHTNDIQLCMD